MIIEKTLNDLKENNINISKYGYKRLFKMYLENKDVDDRRFIFSNITKVDNIQKEDLFEVIKYCALYNRSFNQIRYSKDHTLFNGDYLGTLKLLVDVFKEHLNKFDKKQDYIYFDDEYDYFDLIILYLKEFKDFDLFYDAVYGIYEEIVIQMSLLLAHTFTHTYSSVLDCGVKLCKKFC